MTYPINPGYHFSRSSVPDQSEKTPQPVINPWIQSLVEWCLDHSLLREQYRSHQITRYDLTNRTFCILQRSRAGDFGHVVCSTLCLATIILPIIATLGEILMQTCGFKVKEEDTCDPRWLDQPGYAYLKTWLIGEHPSFQKEGELDKFLSLHAKTLHSIPESNMLTFLGEVRYNSKSRALLPFEELERLLWVYLLPNKPGYEYLQQWSSKERRDFLGCGDFPDSESCQAFFALWKNAPENLTRDSGILRSTVDVCYASIFQNEGIDWKQSLNLIQTHPNFQKLPHSLITLSPPQSIVLGKFIFTHHTLWAAIPESSTASVLSHLISAVNASTQLSSELLEDLIWAHQPGYEYLQQWSPQKRRDFLGCGNFPNSASRQAFFACWKNPPVTFDSWILWKMVTLCYSGIFQNEGIDWKHGLNLMQTVPNFQRLPRSYIGSRQKTDPFTILGKFIFAHHTLWAAIPPEASIISVLDHLVSAVDASTPLSSELLEDLIWTHQPGYEYLQRWSPQQRRDFLGCGDFPNSESRQAFFALWKNFPQRSGLDTKPDNGIKAASLCYKICFKDKLPNQPLFSLIDTHRFLLELLIQERRSELESVESLTKILSAFEQRPDVIPFIENFLITKATNLPIGITTLSAALEHKDMWPREASHLGNYLKIIAYFNGSGDRKTIVAIFNQLSPQDLAALPLSDSAFRVMNFLSLAGNTRDPVTNTGYAAEALSLLLAHNPPPFQEWLTLIERERMTWRDVRDLLLPRGSPWQERLQDWRVRRDGQRRIAPGKPDSRTDPHVEASKECVNRIIDRLQQKYLPGGSSVTAEDSQRAVASLQAIYQRLAQEVPDGQSTPYLCFGEEVVLDYFFDHLNIESKLLRERWWLISVLVHHALNDVDALVQEKSLPSKRALELKQAQAVWFKEALIESQLAGRLDHIRDWQAEAIPRPYVTGENVYGNRDKLIEAIGQQATLLSKESVKPRQWPALLTVNSKSCTDGMLSRCVESLNYIHRDVIFKSPHDYMVIVANVLRSASTDQITLLKRLIERNDSYNDLLAYLHQLAPQEEIILDEDKLRGTCEAFLEEIED